LCLSSTNAGFQFPSVDIAEKEESMTPTAKG
jgi:hypothetical protein